MRRLFDGKIYQSLLPFEGLMNLPVRHSDAELIMPPPIESLLSTHGVEAGEKQFQKTDMTVGVASAREAYLQGLMYWKSEEWNGAAEAFKKLTQLASYPESYNLLGYAYFKLGDFDKAIHAHKKSIKLDPNDFEAHFGLAFTYLLLGKMARALESLRKVIKLNSQDAAAHFFLGYVHSQLHHWELAVNAYKKAIRLKRDYKEAYHYLASLYISLGERFKNKREQFFSQAIETYKRLLEIYPEYSPAYNNIGVIYAWLENPDGALAAYGKALERDPSNPITLQNIHSIKEELLERRLFELGYLERIGKPIIDLTPYQNRRLLEVKGKPLSETIIEERR